MSFQHDLKRYKVRHYNTTKEIGELLGVSQRTAYRLLSGEKIPTKAEAAHWASILAKRDPDLFAAAKSILPSGVSDEFFKSCLKQHRDTLADLQMSIKSIQAEQSAQQAELKAKQNAEASKAHYDFMMLIHKDLFKQKAEINYLTPTVREILQYQLETQNDLTSLWSELQAQKAEIDRLSQRPSLWCRVINFIRGGKNG